MPLQEPARKPSRATSARWFERDTHRNRLSLRRWNSSVGPNEALERAAGVEHVIERPRKTGRIVGSRC